MTSPSRETSAGGLLATLVVLLGLAGLSFGLRFVHLGLWSVPVALAIAAAKAVLVVLFFMELLSEKPAIVYAVFAGLLLLATLLGLVVADVLTRPVAPLGAPPGVAARDFG